MSFTFFLFLWKNLIYFLDLSCGNASFSSPPPTPLESWLFCLWHPFKAEKETILTAGFDSRSGSFCSGSRLLASFVWNSSTFLLFFLRPCLGIEENALMPLLPKVTLEDPSWCPADAADDDEAASRLSPSSSPSLSLKHFSFLSKYWWAFNGGTSCNSGLACEDILALFRCRVKLRLFGELSFRTRGFCCWLLVGPSKFSRQRGVTETKLSTIDVGCIKGWCRWQQLSLKLLQQTLLEEHIWDRVNQRGEEELRSVTKHTGGSSLGGGGMRSIRFGGRTCGWYKSRFISFDVLLYC